MPTTAAAVKLRRLRQRFGISAPKVAVRTHVPWYWRALLVAAVLAAAIAAARWIYDAGRSIAGFDKSTTSEEIATLHTRIGELDGELQTLRQLASSAESSLKMERSAQAQLAQQVRTLEADNAALKQDLAFFEGLIPDRIDGEAGVKISRFRVDRDGGDGPYRYRMMVVHNPTKQQKDFRGDIQFSLLVRQGSKDVMIQLPPNGTDRDRYRIEIRHFSRSEGELPVPPGALLKSVEVRIVQDGAVRARQSVNL